MNQIVVLCTPSLTGPTAPYTKAFIPAAQVLKEAGYDVGFSQEVGCPYISHARSTMLRKALDKKADIIVFIDYDLSFDADALLKLVQTEGDVVAGLYRFKYDDREEYMGALLSGPGFMPIVRADGCIKANRVPAGFLKITRNGVNRFMKAYPHLVYGEASMPSVDIFNHGAHEGQWWGEDFAFSRNWIDCGGEIWVVPDLNLDHHSSITVYPGNFHLFLMRQPGGCNAPNKKSDI